MKRAGQVVRSFWFWGWQASAKHLLNVLGEHGNQTVFAGVEEEGAHIVGHGLHVKGLAVS